MADDKLTRLTKKEEGYRDRLYKDSRGYLTIGWGWCIELTGIKEQVAELALRLHLDDAIKEAADYLTALWGSYDQWPRDFMNTARFAVLVQMFYVLGADKVAKFKKFWAAVVRQDWDAAGDELVDSVWYGQARNRVDRLVDMLVNDRWPETVVPRTTGDDDGE